MAFNKYDCTQQVLTGGCLMPYLKWWIDDSRIMQNFENNFLQKVSFYYNIAGGIGIFKRVGTLVITSFALA
jgi:hypothetical protein